MQQANKWSFQHCSGYRTQNEGIERSRGQGEYYIGCILKEMQGKALFSPR
jgi:hypothetical protein